MGSRSRVFIGHLPAGAAVGSSGVLASLGTRDEGQRKADCVDDVRRRARRWVDCRRRAGGGADRCGDLHRLGDPRLPRPAGRVDEEPGRREDVDAAELPRRSRGSPDGLADARSSRGLWSAQPNAGHRAIVEIERAGKLHGVVTQNIDELHQRAGIDPGARDRGPRHGVVDPLHVVRRSAADGRDADPGRRRRGRPAVPGVRRHPQERHDLVRPVAGARGDRPGDGGQPNVRRAARRRIDAQRVSGGELCAARGGCRRAGGDHQRRGRRRWIDLADACCAARSPSCCRRSSPPRTATS